jgi:hypothetical protein
VILLIPQKGRGNADRDSFPVKIDNVNGLVQYRVARVHSVFESAPFFANTGSEDFPALAADGFFFINPCNFFGRAVERSYFQIGVHRENSVRDTVQDDLCLVFSSLTHIFLSNIFLLSKNIFELQKKV